MEKIIKSQKGIGLGIIIILILLILIIASLISSYQVAPIKSEFASIFTGIYIQFLGVLFLLSYYFPYKTFIFRGLLWVCERSSSHIGQKTAFFYFVLSFVVGTIELLKGLAIITLWFEINAITSLWFLHQIKWLTCNIINTFL